jgi:hypothetical protein
MFKIIRRQPNSPVYFSKKKAKLSGYVLEIANYEREFMLFFKNKRKRKNKNSNIQDSKSKTISRAKKKINDYINSNVWQWFNENKKRIMPIFITLTFQKNIQDLDYANKEFSKFIKRFNYEFFQSKKSILKYVSVIEFQKRGAIHYHMLIFNLPFQENIFDRARKIWLHGSCNVESIKSKKGAISGYLIKYLTKEKTKNFQKDQNCYSVSRGLHKPIESSFEDVVLLIEREINPLNPIHEYERIFQINEKQQTKKAKIFDLRQCPKIYKTIKNYLNIYDY